MAKSKVIKLVKGSVAKFGDIVVEVLAQPRKGQVNCLFPDGSTKRVPLTELVESKAKFKEKAAPKPRAVDNTEERYGFKTKLTRMGVKVAVATNAADGVTRIYPDLSRYQVYENAQGGKTMDCGDDVAEALRDCETEDDMWAIAKDYGLDVPALQKKYSKLNKGMVRMNIGNRIRAILRKQAA